MQTRVRAGPPQIIRLDFQPSEFTTSRWLLHEIKNAGSWLPFINTTGGCKSKPPTAAGACLCSTAGAVSTALAECVLAPAMEDPVTPATAQAAGSDIPAFISAAAIFCCCVIAEAGIAFASLESLKIFVSLLPSLRAPKLACSAQDGMMLASIPGFCDSVPKAKRKFSGLMQYSSTLIRLLGLAPWRSKKLVTPSGISGPSNKTERLYCSWRSQCKSISAPRGSTTTLSVLS